MCAIGNAECMTVLLRAWMWRGGRDCHMLLEELYDALIEAGASEEKAGRLPCYSRHGRTFRKD